MKDVTLTGLRVVLEVGRLGSFTAAAERLGYTQSAVSRQVVGVERAVGLPLFERLARGVRPTAAGDAMLRHAGRVLDDLAAASQEMSGLRDRLAGRLAVGGYPTAMAALVPRAVARLLALHPGLDVRLVESSTPSQLAALRRGRIEVAVLATGEGLPAYDLQGLRRTELRGGLGWGVAVAESHPFAARASLDVDDLAGQPWIVGAGRDGAPEFGAWPGIDSPRIAFAVRGWPTRLGLVAAGLGIALMPGSAAPLVPRGVRWVPVDAPGSARSVWAATATAPGPGAAAMVAALGEESVHLAERAAFRSPKER